MSIEERGGSVGRERPSGTARIDAPIASVPWADLPARVLLCSIFLVSGFGKLAAVAGTQGYMQAYGVPAVLIWPAAVLEIVGGLLVLTGFLTRPVAVVLAGWCLLTAVIFHTAFTDQNQMINFLKNLAMAGGFILLARHGAWTLAVDGFLSRRRKG